MKQHLLNIMWHLNRRIESACQYEPSPYRVVMLRSRRVIVLNKDPPGRALRNSNSGIIDQYQLKSLDSLIVAGGVI